MFTLCVLYILFSTTLGKNLLRFISRHFSSHFGQISNTWLKHRSSKIMPAKHQLDWDNICENDSVTVTSRLYKFTVRSQLEFALQRDLRVLDLLSLRTRSRLSLVRASRASGVSRERSGDEGNRELREFRERGKRRITAEILARSLVNFYCQYADRHMNVQFMRCVNERERTIWQFVIVKNKLMSVYNASVLLLAMNFVIKLSK